MGRRIYLSLVLFVFTAASAFAQSGEIKGKIVDKQTKEAIPFATVTAELNGTVVSGAQTDIDGKYSIKPLTPGKYNVKASFVGYTAGELTGVVVSVENSAFANFELSKGIELGPVEVVSYKIPLIDKGNTTTQTTVTQEEIKNAAVRDVNSIAATTAGIFQADVGGALNIRGSRSDATAYYVDGIKLSGAYSPPQAGTEQVTTITGGVPAQYGDATGGIISITTRGPSKKFSGGAELATSRLFDDYKNDLVALNLSGPIIMKRDTGGRKSSPLAGFFFAGEYNHAGDQSPSAIGAEVVNSTLLSSIEAHPLVKSPTSTGFIQKADFVTNSDLQHMNAHLNSAGNSINMTGKIDIAPSDNVTVTLGGSFVHGDGRNFTYFYELYNYDKNSESINTNYRLYGKLTQKFGNYKEGEKSTSPVKNAFYYIQFDYTNDNGLNQSADHQDNLFNYGYVGKFQTYRAPFYQEDTARVNGNLVLAQVQTSVQDTLVTYTPSSTNQGMANWTSDYYSLAPGKSAIIDGQFVPFYTNINDIPAQGGLINGDNRAIQSVYSLWGSPGRQPNGYSKANNQQYRVTAQGSADIKNHSIVVGMEYEQRINRSYAVSPSGLWTLGRTLANFNNQNLDVANPHPVYDENGIFQDKINYDQKYVQKTVDGLPVKGFFENVRDKLGIPYNQLIDIDSYSPSSFSLNMFTPDELLNNGNNYVAYSGYDYLGNTVSGTFSLSNFLNNKDANNNYTRNIGSFQPSYVAGYIQDRFAFNDLNFNVGLRIDRYDANQPVLKDKYLLYSAHTAGELGHGGLLAANVPGNVPSSSTVYVNDANSPTSVVGYRSGNQFYDANGNQISDYSLIAQSPVTTTGTIQPYLINPSDYYKTKSIRDDAFTTYTPQVTYMPRIAFSFPISDEALFFAHYDVLTQRPPVASQFNPLNYLFFETQAGGGGIANPDLKPEKTTDYELGFKQALTRSSALSISAFYKELRDMIQVVSITGAFPVNYVTYDNIDFGTVKGLSLSYDLRRTGNIRMTANYTLQFADGTGSDAGSQFNVISAGVPNLRTPMPLNFDQRNKISASIDYRYGEGKDYNGPIWFGTQFLQNTGLNVVFNAGSGTPYTRQANITADVISGQAERATLEGSVNGSRLPWNYRVDAKLDRDFTIKVGKEKEGGTRKRMAVNVYVSVLNLFNTQNVLAVYRATGNPNDNGYLSAPSSQPAINSQYSPASYVDLFTVALNNPGNYSLPRRWLFGVKFNLD